MLVTENLVCHPHHHVVTLHTPPPGDHPPSRSLRRIQLGYVQDMGVRILNLKLEVKKSWWLLRYAVICSSNVGPSIVWHIFENVWVLAHVEDMGVEISNLSSEVPNSLRLLR